MSESVPFSRADISPTAYYREAWERVKPQYGLFLGITVVGILLGSVAPLGLLMGPMMCGIYLCYRAQALGQPVAFDRLFKGFDHFTESFIASLLMLAASLVVILPLLALAFIVLFAGILGGAAGADRGLQEGLSVAGCVAMGFVAVLVMAASLLIGILFTFTYPLILDRGLPGLEAVKLSFRAARANLGGLLLLALMNLVLSCLGLLCCYVGVFLLLPLTFGTHWICYERIFGIQGPAEPPPAV